MVSPSLIDPFSWMVSGAERATEREQKMEKKTRLVEAIGNILLVSIKVFLLCYRQDQSTGMSSYFEMSKRGSTISHRHEPFCVFLFCTTLELCKGEQVSAEQAFSKGLAVSQEWRFQKKHPK
ncbi:hypothetical protein MLD38_012690 [Melastoma candidum]|uniref:Uncharacterized protein n=1 Tax=Melastoma candidum TaxID=119954 RepID=A0ACB9R747_9MYRT|nr:hypothetical protein MLD38_012690 [Melastoma candidum]